MRIGQPRVVESQAVQQRRLDIVYMDRVLHRLQPEIIRLSDGLSTPNTTARQPHAKAVRMMIASVTDVSALLLRDE